MSEFLKKNNYFEIMMKLNNFLDSRVIELQNSYGDRERGIFIPFAINGVFEGKDGSAWSKFTLIERPKDSPHYGANNIGGTHSLRLQVPRNHYDKLASMGLKVPFMGSAKILKRTTYNANNIDDKDCKRVKINEDD